MTTYEMKKLVIFSGAGVSAESGIRTFRDANGLWEGHDVMAVASPEGWAANPWRVLEFYNQRRRQALQAEPNQAHFIIAELESLFEVTVITQNVDDLHERAGSSRVLHLHGELSKSRSTINPGQVFDIEGWQLNPGDLCPAGSQLRPHIVWFGEPVPQMEPAIGEVQASDVFIVIGTSLEVYPAASLLHYVGNKTPVYVIDPKLPRLPSLPNLTGVEKTATEGMAEVAAIVSKKYA